MVNIIERMSSLTDLTGTMHAVVNACGLLQKTCTVMHLSQHSPMYVDWNKLTAGRMHLMQMARAEAQNYTWQLPEA